MMADRDDDDAPADASLGDRITRAKIALEPERREHIGDRYNMLSMAWRMTLELVVGAALGFGIGWSLDSLVGTTPLFLIVFGLFGLAAGMKVVMGTAQEMSRRSSDEAQENETGSDR